MSLKKKFLAAMAATALSFSLTFGAPAPVEASSAAESLIGIGIQAAALNAQINGVNNNAEYND